MHESVRHGIKMVVDCDMVVNVDARHEPAADDERCRRQRLELIALDRLEERASAALARRCEGAVVKFLDLLGERGVGLGKREELPMAQRRQYPHLHQSDRIFYGGFVPRLFHPCRDDCDVVMPAERVIAAVQHRVPVVGIGHPRLGVVGVLCPPRLCGKPLRAVAVTATGHISIKGQRAIRATSVRSAKLVFGEVPPKRSKEAGTPPMLPASS